MYLHYPDIDPIIFQIGPFALRWYALAYVVGLMGGWWYGIRLARLSGGKVGERDIDDFLVWATLGVILGGRVGHVLFYGGDHYIRDPLAAFRVWEGGMSFHGGILGVALAGLIFVKKRKISALSFADILSCVAPIGLFLGRIANFINGELWGRATDVPWAMVFPHAGPHPRHPSQLYEAALEGLVLFFVVNWLWRKEAIRNRPGIVAGVFIGGYGLFRSLVELVREPADGFIGPVTAGQALSIPMILIGIWLVMRARKAA